MANLKVITNDRVGDVYELYFNQYQNLVKFRTYSGKADPALPTTETQNRPQNPINPGDPEYYETSYEYTGDYRLKRASFPDGSRMENMYEPEMLNSEPTITNRGNIREVWRYDSQGNPILENAYEYGDAGCGSCGGGAPAIVIDVMGNITENVYDDFGNKIQTISPSVILSDKLNQYQLNGGSIQQAVESWEYNEYGQMTKYTDAEGNVTDYIYYPETDYNGDGIIDNPSGDPVTGGFLKETMRDTTSDAARNSGTNPTPANTRTRFVYDLLGNVTREIDCRGIATDHDYNALGQLIRTRRATANGLYTDVTEPLPLTNYACEERKFYDANGNIVLEQIEDRGNTTSVDGNLSSEYLVAVGLDYANPDPAGGKAYVDTLYKYNMLNNMIEEVREIQNGTTLKVARTRYRYDRDERRVLSIYPDGRADAQFYDERAMNYKSIQGIQTPPPEAVMLSGDPTTFSSPGKQNASPRITLNEYDSNLRLKKVIDASDAGNPVSMNEITYDTYGRKSFETDAMGNKTRYTYDALDRVIRVIREGQYPNDVPGDTNNEVLSVTEYVYDNASRIIATHNLVFDPSDTSPAPTLTVNSDMALIAPYLSSARSNTAPIREALELNILGRITTINEYDKLGRVTFSITPDLGVTRYYYDGLGRTIKTVDSALCNGYYSIEDKFYPINLSGNMSQTAYDKNGNAIEQLMTEVTLIDNVAPENFHITFYYDSLNRVMTQFDNIGRAADFRYDSQGRVVAQADPRGPVSSRSLNRRGLGSSDSVTLNNFGNISRMYYDGSGRALRQESFLTPSGEGNGTYIGADEYGVKIAPPTGYLDANQSGDGIVTNDSAYDEAGFLLARRDDNGNTAAYIFDTLGRQLVERKGLSITGASVSISGGQTAEFPGALPGGESVVITEPDGTDVTLAYNLRGFLLTRTDEAGNIFTYVCDILGRQKSVTVTPAT
jgi:YD repeat-containing protein